TTNQDVATSQEAIQNQNEPQRRDENANNDKSVHGVRNPTYQAGLRRDAVQPDIEAERKNFFFQAEDGIRGGHVTGLQTCALPIWCSPRTRRTRGCSTVRRARGITRTPSTGTSSRATDPPRPGTPGPRPRRCTPSTCRPAARPRSEERRVGKGGVGRVGREAGRRRL